MVTLALTAAAGRGTAAQGGHRKAIIVVLHGVSWEELAAAHVPALQALLRRGAVGAMNSRVLGSPEAADAYLTVGAGRRATARPAPWWLLSPVPAGRASDRDHARARDQLRAANRRAHTQAAPGLLGAALHQGGLRTGILRILDPTVPVRRAPPSVLMAMDDQGRVDWLGVLRVPDTGPVLRQAGASADLLFIDAEPLFHRPAGAPPPPTPDPGAAAKLRQLSFVFEHVTRALNRTRDLLIIVSPTCGPYRSPKGISYSPIAVIGPGFKPGLLTSASTRRAGLVSNTDIAPTVLQYFGSEVPRTRAEPGLAGMSGHPLSWRGSDDPLRDVLAISRRGVRLVQLRWRFGPIYALIQFLAFMAAGAALALAPAWARRRRQGLRIALLFALSVPLALLLLPALDPGGFTAPYVVAAALAAAFAWLAQRGSPALTALGALLSATAGGAVLDAMMGGRLLGNSVISYSPIYGGRFYGIGNEAMGAAIACTAVGGAALVEQRGPTRAALWALGLWFVVATLVIGGPRWGANWGGGLTAAFGLAAAYAAIRAGRPRLRHWLAALAAMVAAGALLVALDLVGGARGATHIGESARLVAAGGAAGAAGIIGRKAAANVHLLVIAPYNAVTLVVLATTLWLVMKPPRRLRAVLESRPSLWGGLAGGTAGALAAVIVNDSGIIAAASALGTIACALAYAALEDPGCGP